MTQDSAEQPTDPTPADDVETSQDQAPSPSRPVRVPNVGPGAVSGLAHEVIGSAATEAYDAGEEVTRDPNAMPDDLDAQIAWVAAGETEAERGERADDVWEQHEDGGSLEPEQHRALGSRLAEAVRGSHDEEPVDSAPSVVTTSARGEAVDLSGTVAETDGTGPAVNGDTGEVTQPGSTLPEVSSAGDAPSTPLDVAQSTGDAETGTVEVDGEQHDAVAPATDPSVSVDAPAEAVVTEPVPEDEPVADQEQTEQP